MENIININEVTKKFKNDLIIKKLSLTFYGGNIYGFIGRNGSGKTVLMKMISGFLKPDTGFIEVNGKILGHDCDFPDNMGILIENPGFLRNCTGFQNLKYLAQIKQEIGDEKIKQLMEYMGLDWKNKKKVGRYSLGMRQRLGIVQAIMEEPEILLLDEPMNGLDENGIDLVRELLKKKKKEGKIVIISSHNKEDIEVLCDVIFKFVDGEIQ